MERRWIIPDVDLDLCGRLSEETRCSAVLAGLLLRRGVSSAEAARSFLEPRLNDLSDPSELPDMDRAVSRIEEAIRRKERIVIFGDYDVDGVSSTCLLLEFFRFIDYPIEYRLPHRLNEGYGLREETVRELAAGGAQLIITVDNGSSSRREIALARELGVDVVVTDHHQLPEDLPEPAALVNPWIDPRAESFKHFAGVGVTFKLVWALCRRLSRSTKVSPRFRDFLLDSLALVALGTIADVVPLSGENRVLAKHGLVALERSRRPGIRRMVREALRGARQGERVESRHVGFRLGPRINAAGRLGCADVAIRLLLAESDAEADELFEKLDRENCSRRTIEREMHTAAREQVLNDVDLARERAIVLGDPSWHPGVVGIVASRLVDEFYRPTVLVALDGERSRGSGRSIPSVDLVSALRSCGAVLDGFGGHALAAGVELDAHRLPDLRRALSEAIDVPVEAMVPEVEADLPVSLGDVTDGLLRELSYLAPHGEGNPEPLLASRELEVVGRPRVMGADGQHLSFFVRENGRAFRAVAFGKGELCARMTNGRPRVSLLFHPAWNSWNGRREIELNVREIEIAADVSGP